MSYFEHLVSKRPNWKPGIEPLWKLQITDQEYEKLLRYLPEKMLSNFGKSVVKEAALFFSEWWKREYSGGPHKKIDVAKKIGLENHCEDLFKLAIKGVESLRIKFIRIETTRYLDTLLLQGGLPLRALAQNDGVNRYEIYLNRIVRYLCTHYLNNWENIDFIEGFNDYISPSFRNDIMYDLTLRIVQAIYYEDDSYFPFNIDDDQFEKLVTSLRIIKRDAKRIPSENPFQIDWFVEKTYNQAIFKYKVECESIISKDWVDRNFRNQGDPFRRLELVIEDHASQKYIRKNNGDYSAKFAEHKIIGSIQDYDNAAVSSQITTNTNKILDISIPNSDLPDLQFPILGTRIDNNEEKSSWKIVNNPLEGNTNVVICPGDWNCQSQSGERIEINEVQVTWFAFEKEIEVTNGIETIRFDSKYSLDYKVDFGSSIIDWIQKYNYFILTSNPQVRVFDFENKRLKLKKYSVFFKLRKESIWSEYNPNNCLPIGLIDFKVIIEDIVTIRKRYFYCGPIDFKIHNSTTRNGEIQISWDEGLITALNVQDGLVVNQGEQNNWEVSYNDDLQSYPETIKFELKSNNDSSNILRISVSTPFKGVVLLDPNGESVENGQTICANALLGYRCLVMGFEEIPVCIQYYKNEYDNNPAEVVTRFFRGFNNKLQMLENDINTIFRINSKSFLEYLDHNEFYLRIGHDLRFKLNQFNCIANIEDGVISVEDQNGIIIPNFQNELFYVPLNCSPDNISINPIEKFEGLFDLYKNKIIGTEIIVFSGSRKNAHLQIRPRYYNLSGIYRKQSHDEIINSIKVEFLESSFNDIVWKIASKYFEVAIEGNIPFETFNHLTAISREKEIMTRFFIYLSIYYQYDEAVLLNQLIRFENEFGQAWLWIKSEVWMESVEFYLENSEIDENYQAEIVIQILKKVIKLLSYHALDKEIAGELFKSFFLGNLFKNEIVTQPALFDIRNIKVKFNNGNGIYIPHYISDIFPSIPIQYRNLFKIDQEELKIWGGLLLSPVFSALAFSGKPEVFQQNNYWKRQRVLYYFDLDPEWFFYVFEKMVKKIIQQN
jgi:hypothetical protein